MRVLQLMLIVMLTVAPIAAQDALVNLDFEEWNTFKGQGFFRDYEEPRGWTSGNGVVHVAPNTDPLTTKSTEAFAGQYCVKMTTSQIFGQIAAGSCFTGTFELNLADPVKSARRGIPYTRRPEVFEGMFRYTSIDGDSATMYATLSRWDATQQRRVVVGEARRIQYTTITEWTRFSIPFTYASAEQPDTIAVVFASSAGGDNFDGSVGSTLWIDAVRVALPTSVVDGHDGASGIASDGRRVLTTSADAVLQDVEVFDVRGVSIRSMRDVGNRTVELDHLPSEFLIVRGVVRLSDGRQQVHSIGIMHHP